MKPLSLYPDSGATNILTLLIDPLSTCTPFLSSRRGFSILFQRSAYQLIPHLLSASPGILLTREREGARRQEEEGRAERGGKKKVTHLPGTTCLPTTSTSYILILRNSQESCDEIPSSEDSLKPGFQLCTFSFPAPFPASRILQNLQKAVLSFSF